MQQLPMVFLSIALGGKSQALDGLGKSLSNDDFGQILGSLKESGDETWQELLGRLGPDRLAELVEQAGEGTSLPQAARIYLQQLRQAADLPPGAGEPINSETEPSTEPGGGSPGAAGELLWSLSQGLPAQSESSLPTAAVTAVSVPVVSESEPNSAPLAATLSRPAPTAAVGPQPAWSTWPVGPAASAAATAADRLQPGVTESVRQRIAGLVSPGVATPPGVEPDLSSASHAAVQGAATTRRNSVPVELPAAGPSTVTQAPPAEQASPAQSHLAGVLRDLLRPATAVGAEPGSRSGAEPATSLEAAASRPAELPFGFLSRDLQPRLATQPPSPVQSDVRLSGLLPSVGSDPSPSSSGVLPESLISGDKSTMGFGGLASIGDGLVASGSGPRAVGPAPELSLPQRLHEPGWSQALGERLVLMAGREQQSAEIKLNPPHLGPLEVKLSLQQDQASVTFLAQHGPVREALEQAIPRLREMFGQQDIQLVNVDVGQRREQPTGGQGEGRGQTHAPDAGGATAGGDTLATVELPVSSRSTSLDGGLDLYA